jgi:hypothetical protein
MYIWGRGGVKYETPGGSLGGLNISNMWIGGGLLHPPDDLLDAEPAKSVHAAGEQEHHNQMETTKDSKASNKWHWTQRSSMHVSLPSDSQMPAFARPSANRRQRVRLQQLIASHMICWIKGVSPSAKHWLELETRWGMTGAFKSGDLTQWFKGIPHDLEPCAWELVANILSELENTGVDHDNQLRLAWLHVDNSLEGLKIQRPGSNFWARALTDSWSSTAFVSITPLCLNTSSDFHECKQKIPIAHKPSQVFSLCTRVRPQCEDYHSREVDGEFNLKDGKSYWMGPKDLMLLATASASADGERFKLNVKKSKILARLSSGGWKS